MNFAQDKGGSSRLTGLGLVVLVHVLIIGALASGLGGGLLRLLGLAGNLGAGLLQTLFGVWRHRHDRHCAILVLFHPANGRLEPRL